jgi:hypothetical protein
MEIPPEDLTSEIKGDIFEIVNTTHLHLKGDKKRATKGNFKRRWNADNMCFTLMIALYNSEEQIEKLNGEIDEIPKVHKPEDWDTQKVSWKKYMRAILIRNEAIDLLEKQLDDVEAGKGYIKIDKHEELMKQQLEDQQVIIRDYGDQIRKWKKTANDYEYKCEKVSNRKDVQIAYLTKELDKLSKPNVE